MIELLQKWASLAPDEVRVSAPLKDHNSRTFWMVYFTAFGQYFITLSDEPMGETERNYADCLVQGAVQLAILDRGIYKLFRNISPSLAVKAYVEYLEGLTHDTTDH